MLLISDEQLIEEKRKRDKMPDQMRCLRSGIRGSGVEIWGIYVSRTDPHAGVMELHRGPYQA
jgi:hypothetical protein